MGKEILPLLLVSAVIFGLASSHPLATGSGVAEIEPTGCLSAALVSPPDNNSPLSYPRNSSASASAAPAPETYDYVVVPIRGTRASTSYITTYLMPHYAQQVQSHRLSWPVPSVGEIIHAPDSPIDLAIIQAGDRNLRWFNIANCVTKLSRSYALRQLIESQSPWSECIIQHGFYLEGYVRMVERKDGGCQASVPVSRESA